MSIEANSEDVSRNTSRLGVFNIPTISTGKIKTTTAEMRSKMSISASPTDRLMSPCTKKLYNNSKRAPPRPVAAHHIGIDLNKEEDFTEDVIPIKYSLETFITPSAYPGGDLELILGTSSKNRKAIMDALGWKYTQMSPDIDEKLIRHEDPMTMPLLIAKAKAEALILRLKVENRTEPCLILTSDQIVVHGSEIREKPESREEAIRFLSSYSDSSVKTISAIVITQFPSQQQVSSVHSASVNWFEIPNDVVSKVVDKELIFSSAGGFQIEDCDLNPLISSIDGGVDSVMGLSVECTIRLMDQLRDILLDACDDSNYGSGKSFENICDTQSKNAL